MNRYVIACLAIVALALGACSANPSQGSSSAAEETAAGEGDTESVAPDGETGSATVTVESGDLAGTYEVAPILDCNTSATGGGFAGGDFEAAEGISSLIAITHSAPGEVTDEGFALQVTFTDDPTSFNDTSYEVGTYNPADPASFKGSGTLKTSVTGSTLQLSFDGATAEGVNFTVEGECSPVVQR